VAAPVHVGADGGPLARARRAAAALAAATGRDRHDVAVVLGTGLSGVATHLGAGPPDLDLTALPGFADFGGPGHRGDAWSLVVDGAPVLVVAGRHHLYEGHGAHDVVHTVRTAVLAGCRTVVLTNAAGGIRPDLAVGAPVLICDHLNLTGDSPLTGIPDNFIDLVDAWSPRLRDAARAVDPALAEGVYAQVRGPQLESPAEITMLEVLGADLVGMSTVLEAIAARHLGAEVLGLSAVTNRAAGRGDAVDLADVRANAAGAAARVSAIVRGVIERRDGP
jgi:purine-nucleoside phosphorylase